MTTICRTSIALLAVLALAACGDSGAPKFRSTDITGADFGSGFELHDPAGHLRQLSDFKGKAVVLFFGYTHCPDVCPTTLADLAQAMKKLGPLADRVQVLFVTVDPERDTPAVLAQYVPAFDPRFLGLRGDAAQTERVAKDFKVYYEKRAGKSPGEYSVDHSAQSYVFDPQGKLRLYVRQDRIAEDLVPDLRILLGASS